MAQPNILWCGGEDIDFPNGAGVSNATTAGTFRTDYARCSLAQSGGGGGTCWSNAFSGVGNDFWFSMQYDNRANFTNNKVAGVFNLSDQTGVILGQGSNRNKLAVFRYDTGAKLTEEVGLSIPTGTIVKVDMHVTISGGNINVDVYVTGGFLFNYNGALTISPPNSVIAYAVASTTSFNNLSEFIVADGDTRSMSLVTMAPNAAGTTDQWTGAYTDVSEIVLNDATAVYSDVVGQVEQFNLINLPTPGSFFVHAVKINARASKNAAVNTSRLSLGFNNAGGQQVDLDTSFQPKEVVYNLSPITGDRFQQSEMDSLQLYMRTESVSSPADYMTVMVDAASVALS